MVDRFAILLSSLVENHKGDALLRGFRFTDSATLYTDRTLRTNGLKPTTTTKLGAPIKVW
jgi:hypothetical protein